ncbi:MAG: DUF6056 family protein [Blautia sp.]|nr:DUF6056 family protein [Blautia sp.]
MILSLLPMFFAAGADRATGDDVGYGILTHWAWVETHSLWKVFLAACQHVKDIYFSWQGTWFSVFLFTLQPEVFSHEAYWVVPYIMTFLLAASLSYALYQFLVRMLRMSVWDYLLLDAVLLLLLIQFVPYKQDALFWYTGAAHYTAAFAFALFSAGCALRYAQTFRIRHLAAASVWMTLLGGMSYLAAFLALLLVILIIASSYKKEKRIILLMIPLALEMAGLLVSALAPGNAVRGGEEYEIGIGRMLWAVSESFRQGIFGIFQSVKEYPVVLAGLLIASLLLWDILQELVEKERLRFPLPGVVLFYFFGTYCAMYWPEVFVGDATDVSNGVPNTVYWALVLMLFCSMLYGLGWLAAVRSGHRKEKGRSAYGLYLAGVAAALLIVAVNYRDIGESTFYMCYRYIRTGQARDYKERMDEVTEILLNSREKDVILPGIFEEEGPLMNMPVTTDPDEWMNRKVSAFYGKDSVIAVPREIYEGGVTEEELEELRRREQGN